MDLGGFAKHAEIERAAQTTHIETIDDRLSRQLTHHQERIEKITQLRELLKRNPDFQELLNLTREVL